MYARVTKLQSHVNGGPGMLVEYYLLLAITLVLIAARVHVALRITHIWDAADITILIAVVFQIAGAACVTMEVKHGLGQHIRNLPDPKYSKLQILRWNTYFQLVYVLATLFTKYSISLYILRIKKNRPIMIVLSVMMFVMTLATIAVIIMLCVACIPMKSLWDPSIDRRCLPLPSVYIVSYVQSACTIVVDLGLTLSPIVILWNVKIRMDRKLFIIFLMSLGLIATATNAARNGVVPELTATDSTFDSIPIIVLCILELSAGVIAACVPACVPLVTKRKNRKVAESLEINESSNESSRRLKSLATPQASIHVTTDVHTNSYDRRSTDEIERMPWENST